MSRAATIIHAIRTRPDLIRQEVRRRRLKRRTEDQRLEQASLYRNSFSAFFRAAWEWVETTDLRWSWYLDALTEHLQAVADGDIDDLLINIAPGYGKSLGTSVLWPVWRWTKDPAWKVITGSYDQVLAYRDAVKSRDLIATDWFRQTFRPSWSLHQHQQTKGLYLTTARGQRFSTSVGSRRITGFRGNAAVVDDPVSAKDRDRPNVHLESVEWWTRVIPTRLDKTSRAERVVIMQRLHKRDLSAICRELGYAHLCIPTEYDPATRCHTSIGFVDPRTEPGELVAPNIQSVEDVAKLKKLLGSTTFAAQENQAPRGAGGGIIRRDWVRRYHVLPRRFDRVVSSWDLSFKKTTDGSFVAGQIWGQKGIDFYLMDRYRQRIGFVETIQAILTLNARWSQVSMTIVEDKANGPAVISALQDKVPGLVPWSSRDSKQARLYACEGFFQAGNIWVPVESDWVDEYLDELCDFPDSEHDDEVDTTTQALLRLTTAARGFVPAGTGGMNNMQVLQSQMNLLKRKLYG